MSITERHRHDQPFCGLPLAIEADAARAAGAALNPDPHLLPQARCSRRSLFLENTLLTSVTGAEADATVAA